MIILSIRRKKKKDENDFMISFHLYFIFVFSIFLFFLYSINQYPP